MSSPIAEASKQALANALLSLMEHEPFEKISISEIAGKAGVARLTFYRHFSTKEEVLKWHLDGLFEAYKNDFAESPATSLEDALTLCFVYWENNADTLKMLSRNGLGHLLAEPFDDYTRTILRAYRIDVPSSLQIRFLAGGLSFAMLQWIGADSPKITARKAARDILSMIELPERE